MFCHTVNLYSFRQFSSQAIISERNVSTTLFIFPPLSLLNTGDKCDLPHNEVGMLCLVVTYCRAADNWNGLKGGACIQMYLSKYSIRNTSILHNFYVSPFWSHCLRPCPLSTVMPYWSKQHLVDIFVFSYLSHLFLRYSWKDLTPLSLTPNHQPQFLTVFNQVLNSLFTNVLNDMKICLCSSPLFLISSLWIFWAGSCHTVSIQPVHFWASVCLIPYEASSTSNCLLCCYYSRQHRTDVTS